MKALTHLITIFFMLFAISIQSSSDQTYKIKDFSGGAFSLKRADGVYNLDIGLNEINELLVSFGDFNGDTFNDLVTISENKSNFTVFLWSDNSGNYEYKTSVHLEKEIISVIPVDFNNDGNLDLMVTTKGENGFILNYFEQKNDYENIFEGNPKEKLDIAEFHPTIVDLDGDHGVDVLYLKQENGKLNRMIWRMDNTDGKEKKIPISISFDNFTSDRIECDLKYKDLQKKVTSFSAPHYNSFIDLNGDCKADLFITSLHNDKIIFEYWINQNDEKKDGKRAKFCLVNFTEMGYANEIKGIAFADIDFDGGIDMAIGWQKDQNASLELIYNVLPQNVNSMCSLSSSDSDKHPFAEDQDKNRFLRLIKENTSFFSFNENFPSMLRFGDVDADSHPDLLVTLLDIKTNISQSHLLKNDNCGDFCKGKSHHRVFNLENKDFDPILKTNSLYATFVDIGELGILDIMQVVKKNNTYVIQALFNYLNPDTFFLKALGLNGFAAGKKGGIYYGSTFQCVITTLDGDQKLSNNVQLYQSGYAALQTPYAFIGLGRTNNYVENFYVGMPSADPHSKSWTPIIPNSQLIISPAGFDTDDWNIDIYVNPTKATLIVVISTVCILFIIGIAIWYLHRKEKEEDKQNHIQFIAFFR